MGEPTKEKASPVDPFLEWLVKHKRDRGIMADLRHGLSEATEYRAWPHVVPWLGKHFENDTIRAVWLTVGATFAVQRDIQPVATGSSVAVVLRRLALGPKGSSGRAEEGLATFAARFRRFLTCETRKEVCERLPGVIQAATRQSPPIPIDLRRLYDDLSGWGEWVKIRWAREYWGKEDTMPVEAEAGGGGDRTRGEVQAP